MLAVLSGEPDLQRVAGGAERPATKFELRGLKLGHTVHDFVFQRRS
jgi:hypothetical protein